MRKDINYPLNSDIHTLAQLLEALRSAYSLGWTNKEFYLAHGGRPSSWTRAFAQAGVLSPAEYNAKRLAQKKKLAAKHLSEGASNSEVVKLTGLSAMTVSNIAREKGIKRKKRVAKSEKWALYREIQQKAAAGETVGDLADEYGYSRALILHVLKQEIPAGTSEREK